MKKWKFFLLLAVVLGLLATGCLLLWRNDSRRLHQKLESNTLGADLVAFSWCRSRAYALEEGHVQPLLDAIGEGQMELAESFADPGFKSGFYLYLYPHGEPAVLLVLSDGSAHLRWGDRTACYRGGEALYARMAEIASELDGR